MSSCICRPTAAQPWSPNPNLGAAPMFDHAMPAPSHTLCVQPDEVIEPSPESEFKSGCIHLFSHSHSHAHRRFLRLTKPPAGSSFRVRAESVPCCAVLCCAVCRLPYAAAHVSCTVAATLPSMVVLVACWLAVLVTLGWAMQQVPALSGRTACRSFAAGQGRGAWCRQPSQAAQPQLSPSEHQQQRSQAPCRQCTERAQHTTGLPSRVSLSPAALAAGRP